MQPSITRSGDVFACEWCGPGQTIQISYRVPVVVVLRSLDPSAGQIHGEVCVLDEEVREEFDEHAEMVARGVRCTGCYRPVPTDVAESALAYVRERDWPAWEFGF